MKIHTLKIILLIISINYSLTAQGFTAKITPISKEIKTRMIKGNSWKQGCPVPLQDLRYIRVKHWDFKGGSKIGELIVHKDAAPSMAQIFEELYAIGYPIKQMRLVSDFKGKDWHSIEADNTSALNCRSATGTKRWSNHAYGKAIDINPIENPYISRKGYISHKASQRYRKRAHYPKRGVADRALITKDDEAYRIFIKHGWKWGGEWEGVKDYQHFDFEKSFF